MWQLSPNGEGQAKLNLLRKKRGIWPRSLTTNRLPLPSPPQGRHGFATALQRQVPSFFAQL